MRGDEIENAEQVGVKLVVVLAERRAAEKRRAPFAGPKQGKEPKRKLVEPFQNPIQFRGPELLQPADYRKIAPQFLESVIADGNTEILSGDVFHLVRLVKYHRVVVGQNPAFVVFVFEREVSEEQVVID